MDFYKRALELQEETAAHRRYFHYNAEVGLDMPLAVNYIIEKLGEYGIKAQRCGHGVTATIGSEGKTLLLRADMDALPMPEQSGEPFACPTGLQDHACGHDLHAAMLLTAAKMLKECESQLKGRVKFMFQPAEETFEGSLDMIKNGILKDPIPDAAMAVHVAPGRMPIGLFMYNAGGVMMSSVDGFKIVVKGKGSHGAYPNLSIDPIHTAVQIYTALEGLIARVADPEKTCVLTVGRFSAGNAANIIPEVAEIEGTLRTNDKNMREILTSKIEKAVKTISDFNGASAEIIKLSQVPPLICNAELTEKLAEFMQELPIPGITPYPGMHANASEDFACIAQEIPSTLLYLSAGFPDERGDYSAHNPKVRFNEQVLPVGAAGFAHCAYRWLEQA